jgi:hypothetical protein
MRFDPKTHTYYDDDGNVMPSVTQIIRAVLNPPQYGQEWHLQRGRANHACYAMIADGVYFKCDPQSEPYEAGCRMFFRDFSPVVIHCELPMFGLGCAGTLDLAAMINNRLTIIDYKNSASPVDYIQMAAYAELYRSTAGNEVRQLMSVEINGNGRYKAGKIVSGQELRWYASRWNSVFAVYKIKQNMGLI